MIKIKLHKPLAGSTFQRVAANEYLLPGFYAQQFDRETLPRTTFGDTGFNATLDGFGLVTDSTFLNGGTVTGMTLKAPGGVVVGTLTGMNMAATSLETAIGTVLREEGDIHDLIDLMNWENQRIKITGHKGKDVAEGGNKADVVNTGGSNDLIIATAGADKYNGGNGRDTISYEDITTGIKADLGAGTVKFGGKTQKISGIEVLAATNKADDLTGSSGEDTIFGLAGSDQIKGLGGADRLFGEDGNDNIFGGPEIDNLFGGKDGDHLYGGNGGDVLKGQGGNDTLHGNVGHDKLFGGPGWDYLHGDSGNDTMTGGAGHDSFFFDDLKLVDGRKVANFEGNDVITDFSFGDGITTFLSKTANITLSQVGSDAVIAYLGGSITLNNVDSTLLEMTSNSWGGVDITFAIF